MSPKSSNKLDRRHSQELDGESLDLGDMLCVDG